MNRTIKILLVLIIGLTTIIIGCKKEEDPPPSPPVIAGTCSDGVKNQDETGIDCGGVCTACVVETCSDGIQNQDETGVDCGGVCTACPINTPCTLAVNTSDFPNGLTDDSYSTFSKIDVNNGNYELIAGGSKSTITITFKEIPTTNKIYTTTSSVNKGFLTDNQVVVSVNVGSYLYDAGAYKDVYVHVNGSVITAEFCSLIFNSGSYGSFTDLVVSGNVQCN